MLNPRKATKTVWSPSLFGSVALFRMLGDDWGTARALNNLGIVVRGQGDYDRAAMLCEAIALAPCTL